jgi:hypothetical protein
MSTEVPSASPDDRHRWSIRLPRQLWIGLAACVVVTAGLVYANVLYQRQKQEQAAMDALFWVMLAPSRALTESHPTIA